MLVHSSAAYHFIIERRLRQSSLSQVLYFPISCFSETRFSRRITSMSNYAESVAPTYIRETERCALAAHTSTYPNYETFSNFVYTNISFQRLLNRQCHSSSEKRGIISFIRSLVDMLSSDLFIYVFNSSYFRLRSDRHNRHISYTHTVYTHMQYRLFE